MDLAFTAEETAFRDEIRAWVRSNLPADIAHKVFNSLHLTREDHQRWARILGAKGWLGWGWPKEHGGPGWNAVQRHLFEEETALAGAPRVMPFGPVMVAPVIMAFGTPEQQRRFLPGIASGEVWWSQGYSEPGSGSDLASLKCKAERRGDYYLVNGQKTWTTMGQYGDWIFCLVRTSNEGKPQTGISFLLIDMKSPGVSVRPIVMLDGGHEVNEVWFDNVEVPADQLIGEENKGWTYAKHLLSHERTNIADVNRAKRELERLKRIAKDEGLWDGDARFRDQIALLEVDVVALEMMVLRVLSAETSGKQSLDVAGLLKIRGSEIQQRYTELMMLAAGPFALPMIKEAMEAGWQGDSVGAAHCAPLASTYFNYRKTSIYGGSNEVQRNIVAQTVLGELIAMDFNFTDDQVALRDAVSRWVEKDFGFERRHAIAKAGGKTRKVYDELAALGLTGLVVDQDRGGLGFGPVEAMVVMEELGRGLVNAPYAAAALVAPALMPGHPWLGRIAEGSELVVLAHQEARARYRLDAVETVATPQAGGWALSGRKHLVPAGDEADLFLVPARLGPHAVAPLGLFLVERERCQVRAYPTQDGARAADVTLAAAPAELLSDDALPALERAIDIGIAAACAEGVGAMDALVAMTVEYMNTRKQFGATLASFQALRHRMADVKMQLELARSMSYFASLKLGEPAAQRRRAVSQAKVQLGQSMRFVGQQCIQLHGGIGVTDECAASHYFKRLTMLELAFGDTLHHLGEVSERMTEHAGVFA